MQALCEPEQRKLIHTMWSEGATLAEICQTLGLPLFTVVMSLRQNGVTEAAMAPRMPDYNDPLCVEYRRVVARKAASKSRPIQINPVRRVSTSNVSGANARKAAPTNHNSEPEPDLESHRHFTLPALSSGVSLRP
jgi:hypothetical protein